MQPTTRELSSPAGAAVVVPPPCPITGAPAVRSVERVRTDFLAKLWRHLGGVDVRSLFAPAEYLYLWESPTGLAYFDPPITGDAAFYQKFYARIAAHEKLAGSETERVEFRKAASQVPDGARVLDVGCGHGGFRQYVTHAQYTGLDPNFAAQDPTGAILDETIEAHAARVGPVYDVACAFQVLEHIADPLGFARAMAAAVRPGGLVLIAVPLWPSPNTEIPNFLISAPPHHVTWWTPRALEALATAIGCRAEAVHDIGMDQHDAIIYWMTKVSPVRCRGRHFKAAWSWVFAFIYAYGVARVLDRFLPLPEKTPTNSLLLVARKAP